MFRTMPKSSGCCIGTTNLRSGGLLRVWRGGCEGVFCICGQARQLTLAAQLVCRWFRGVDGVSPPEKFSMTISAPAPDGLLPAHGRVACSVCFPKDAQWGVSYLQQDGWLLENNPLACGARNPKTLLLGFSKGVRQSSDLLERSVEDVAYAGFRSRVTQALQLLGLLLPDDEIENHFRADEPDWGFGDVVRCSIAKLDSATGKYLKSGDVIPASARRAGGADWIGNCMRRFLATLPPRLETVILLSNDDAYVDACFDRVHRLHPNTRRINEVAYGTGKVVWVHMVHFGGTGFNHMTSWLEGKPNKQGRKRDMAIAALRSRGSFSNSTSAPPSGGASSR
jgi:hypothetical protein